MNLVVMETELMGTDDTTQNLPNDQFNRIIAEFRALGATVDGVVNRLDSLENRVSERLKNTQPLRETLQAELAKLRDEFRAELSKLRDDVGAQLNKLRDEFRGEFQSLDSKVDNMSLGLSDKLDVLNDSILEVNAKHKRLQSRVTELEKKAS
jgi:uncharacterized phage infection (PIP) family protein YhgE